MTITDADREAAAALRAALADISGFWHNPGDDSAICLALAQHRIAAEKHLAARLAPIMASEVSQTERRAVRGWPSPLNGGDILDGRGGSAWMLAAAKEA